MREENRTHAIRLNSRDDLTLTGELHSALWSEPTKLARLSHLVPEFESLSEAASRPDEEATVGALLAGSGWGHLFLELTGRCNERCVHCYASSSPEVEEALDLETIRQVITDAAELGFNSIQLTGGDPLLSPHLLSAVEHSHAMGFRTIEVYTNGLALKQEIANKLASFGVKMALSVYSHDAARHDAVTGTLDSLNRTLRAISYAVKAGIEVRVGVVLREENLNDADPIRRLLQEYGVPPEKVGVDRERPVGRGDWKEQAPIPISERGAGIHASDKHDKASGKLAVSYHGDVVPCIFDRQTKLGNVKSGKRLPEILGQMVAFSKPHRLSVISEGEPLACGDCRARRELLQILDLTAP